MFQSLEAATGVCLKLLDTHLLMLYSSNKIIGNILNISVISLLPVKIGSIHSLILNVFAY